MIGAGLGLCGVLTLIENGSKAPAVGPDAAFYLSLIGIAAGLWGFYSVASRRLLEVPSSVLGVFYAAAAAALGAAHLLVETWVQPTLPEWAAMATLGDRTDGPRHLLLGLWNEFSDIQALGAFSYVEPFIGALLAALSPAKHLTGSCSGRARSC